MPHPEMKMLWKGELHFFGGVEPARFLMPPMNDFIALSVGLSELKFKIKK